MRTETTAVRSGDDRPLVTFFLQDLHGGGAERVTLNLATAIAARDCRVDLVLVRGRGQYMGSIPKGIRVTVLNKQRTFGAIMPLIRYLWRERPAAMLTALVHVNIAGLIAAGLSGTGVRVVVTEHSQITRSFEKLGKGLVRTAYKLVPKLYPRASAVVAVSSGVADDLAVFSGLPRESITVIHNGIISPLLHQWMAQPCDHPWFAPHEPPVILSAGRLEDVKDYATLIRAFARIREYGRCRLVILGEGELRSDLEKLVSDLGLGDDVQMPGFCPNPYAMMSAAAVFVQSSKWEGLPGVLVEAMACGTSIVATDCPGGTREVLDNGRLGSLVPVGDDAALAVAILKTLQNPSDVHELAVKAAEFTTDRAADRYLGILLGHGIDGKAERPVTEDALA